MRNFLYLLIPLMFMHSVISEGQMNVSIRKKDFKLDNAGFKAAWDHINKGDSYYIAEGISYSLAFDEYLQAIVYNNENAELNYKAGVSALFSDKKEESAGFFLKALELKGDVAEDILLLTGRSLQYSGRYSEAIEKYKAFQTSKVRKSAENISAVIKWINECNSALVITKDTLRVEIINAGDKINSISDDYSELFSSDGNTLYFASRRKLPKSSDYYPDTKFDENIFTSILINGEWDVALSAGKNLLTKYCETPLFISPANDLLYIYAGYENGGDIMVSENKKGVWKTPQTIPFDINTSGSETSFTFSPSGKEIYFVTDDASDKTGGKDIYFIKKLTERKWSKPQNAGPAINTVFDEESVRFSKFGDTLWFSSKGHNSIGGFDIFYSIRNQEGRWDTARNCGYPVNTPWDEMFYYPSPGNDSSFYFVSNRNGGFGGLDIYRGRILPPEPVVIIEPPAPPAPDTVIIKDTVVVIQEVVTPPVVAVIKEEPVLYLIGSIQDSETGDPVMARLEVIDISTDLAVGTTASSDIDGSYRIRLPEKKSYMIDLRATGFLSEMKKINVPDTFALSIFRLDVSMVRVKVGKKVVMNNIFFETGKAILTPGSYAEIDRLVSFMQDNPKMKIEISGHTDKTGSEPINFKLSENRAKAVLEYMVKKGIDATRMEFKGFGSLQPVADNKTAQGRAQNRRVEFKILEF
jgi:outer membrane protein OmpA-like peptidoglycan-associated protein